MAKRDKQEAVLFDLSMLIPDQFLDKLKQMVLFFLEVNYYAYGFSQALKKVIDAHIQKVIAFIEREMCLGKELCNECIIYLWALKH